MKSKNKEPRQIRYHFSSIVKRLLRQAQIYLRRNFGGKKRFSPLL